MERAKVWLSKLKNQVTKRDFLLIQKAVNILMGNICDGPEYPWYPFRCICPFGGSVSPQKTCDSGDWESSFDSSGLRGIWNWDSAFHANGAAYFDNELAKEQILGFTQYQLQNGMFIDMILKNGEIGDYSSKPPVLAWAAARVYQNDKDIEFAKVVYPRLVKNEEFWTRDRFCGGMFRYGANMDSLPFADLDRCVRYESGWDNSVRWDSPCSDYWPIDLNCYAVMMYRGLRTLAVALGLAADAAVYEAKEKTLTENINRYLWNDEIKSYTDLNRFTKKPSSIMSPASFLPLYIHIATEERAKHMLAFAKDPKKFYPGMPTVGYDNPAYSDDYWRGPTWLNVAYFAAKGIKDYGYDDVADDIRNTILSWVEKDGDCIHENYNSTTGKGLFCPNFGWSAVFVMEFILNFK